MDLKHGMGYRVYENGARYIGQWEDGQRQGVGTMVWPNGDVYRGEWENGTMNGQEVSIISLKKRMKEKLNQIQLVSKKNLRSK